jgi:hypothetical protein
LPTRKTIAEKRNIKGVGLPMSSKISIKKSVVVSYILN